MALIKCPECGKEFSDRASACPNCSCPTKDILQDLQNAAVESEKLKQIICPRCGSSVKADGDYCDNCGRRITPYKNDSTTAVIPQVPSNPNLTENSFYTICPVCKILVKKQLQNPKTEKRVLPNAPLIIQDVLL